MIFFFSGTIGHGDIKLFCNIFNQTFSSFTVDCHASGDEHVIHSRTHISYQFEIKNIHSGAIIRNVSTSTPKVTIIDLPSASEFLVTVYSYQNNIRSKEFTLEGFTTRPGEKQLATMPEIENKNPMRFVPILVGFILISLLLVLITITVVAIIR